MKVPLSWLHEFLSTDLSLEKISEILTNLGLEVEGIEGDIFDIALTPNLSHCASIRGVARELAAALARPLSHPKFAVAESIDLLIDQQIQVTVAEPTLCPRYACRLITGIQKAPSPPWLIQRLEQCGLRSVNLVVDVTNLVLLELGHPLHAFDYDRLSGKQIVVRKAKKGETLVTLDGFIRHPTEETLLICDAKKPVAIAGIMGSLESEVSENTTSILLEAAYFDPAAIRRAGKQLGLRTEASYRFERGVDPNGLLEALERAASWICELTGGIASRGVIDIQSAPFLPLTVSCRLSRLNALLGTQLAMGEVETLFKRLELSLLSSKEDPLEVKIPTWRRDLTKEIDLIEEAARLYGYENIVKKERALYRTGCLSHSPEYVFARKVRCRLIAEGLQEFLSCDLISPDQASLISTDTFPSRTLIHLLNPHSSEQSVMRPSLLPGMLRIVQSNATQGIHSLAGFEVGRIHFSSKERYLEPSVLAIILTGERTPFHWEKKENAVDFFDLKGILENLFTSLQLPPPSFHCGNFANFHPGRQATVRCGSLEVGIMGEIHPLTLKHAGIEHPVYFAELNLQDLQQLVHDGHKMEPLPQFPTSVRDLTVTLTEDRSIAEIFQLLEKEHNDLLEHYFLLDLYRNSSLGTGLKNATFRCIYRDKEKTLSLAAVESAHTRITHIITEYLKRESS